MKDGIDGPHDPKDAEIAAALEKWPEVAEPAGGYVGLVERVENRMSSAGNGKDEKLDVTAKPDLPAEAGEPAAEPAAASGPTRDRDSQAYIAARASLAAPTKKKEESKKAGGMSAEGAESGKIDLKSLLSQGLDLGSGAKASQPNLAAATPLMPDAKAAAPVQTTPEKKSNTGMIVVLALAAGVGGAFFFLRGTGSEDRAAEEAAAPPAKDREGEMARAPEPLPQAESAAPSTAGEAPATAAEVGAVAQAEVPSAEGAAHERRSVARETHAATAAAAPAPQTAAPAPAATAAPASTAPTKSRGADDLDALLSGATHGGAAAPGAAPAAAAPAEPAAGALPQPNRAQIQTAMNRVAGAVRNCTQGTPGTAMVSVTFESGGSVTGARVVSGYTGAVASCIAGAVQAARVPAFTRPTVTVTFPFVVRPPE